MPLAECVLFLNNKKQITKTIPNNYNNDAITKPAPGFTFPFSEQYNTIKTSNKVQHFTFVQTCVDKSRYYGFVRLKPNNEAIVIISKWFFWKDILLQILRLLDADQANNGIGASSRRNSTDVLGKETLSSEINSNSVEASSSSSDSDSSEEEYRTAEKPPINQVNNPADENSEITLLSSSDLVQLQANGSNITKTNGNNTDPGHPISIFLLEPTHYNPDQKLQIYLNSQNSLTILVPDTLGQSCLKRTATDQDLVEVAALVTSNKHGSSIISKLYSSIMHERIILVSSSNLSIMTSLLIAMANILVFPLKWEHMFTPILPSKMIQFVGAPFPAIMGIHSSLLNEAKILGVFWGFGIIFF